MSKRNDFLSAVLGRGAEVLDRLAKASPEVSAYLVPRVAAAWVSQVDGADAIPGVPEQRFVLSKAGDGTYHGVAELGGTEYAWVHAPVSHVAAVIAVAIGAEPGRPDLKDVDLARLGKTIDLLVKSKKEPAIGTGGAAAATPPLAPEPPSMGGPDSEPTAASTKLNWAKAKTKKLKPKLPKLAAPKAPKVKLTLSEAVTPCQVCRGTQFQGQSFRGCFCLRDLAKSARSVQVPGGYELVLGQDWDNDAVLTLLECVGRKSTDE